MILYYLQNTSIFFHTSFSDSSLSRSTNFELTFLVDFWLDFPLFDFLAFPVRDLLNFTKLIKFQAVVRSVFHTITFFKKPFLTFGLISTKTDSFLKNGNGHLWSILNLTIQPINLLIHRPKYPPLPISPRKTGSKISLR